MKTPIRYPSAQDFVSAIAQPFDSESGRRIAEPFGVVWSDAVGLDRNLEIYDISRDKAFGLGLTYKDVGLVSERENHKVGDGPFVLTHCAFWGHEDECGTYEGPLWKDLQFSDTQADAIAKLGEPSRIGRFEIHRWELPDFRLTIQWKSPDKIRVVSYWLKQDG